MCAYTKLKCKVSAGMFILVSPDCGSGGLGTGSLEIRDLSVDLVGRSTHSHIPSCTHVRGAAEKVALSYQMCLSPACSTLIHCHGRLITVNLFPLELVYCLLLTFACAHSEFSLGKSFSSPILSFFAALAISLPTYYHTSWCNIRSQETQFSAYAPCKMSLQCL